MKKIVFSVIFLFKLSDAMDKPQKDSFEAFKATCKSKQVNHPAEVCVDQIQTNPTELCAAIRHLSWLARELPPESYEQSLKTILREQREKDWRQYQKVVSQLAHMALSRHRESHDYISPLIFQALRKQCYACRDESEQLREVLTKDVNEELLAEYDQLQIRFEDNQRELESATRKLNKVRQRLERKNSRIRQLEQRADELERKSSRMRQLEQQDDALEREKRRLTQWAVGHQAHIEQLERDIRRADIIERQNNLLRQREMEYQTRIEQLQEANALLRESKDERSRSAMKKKRGLRALLCCCGK